MSNINVITELELLYALIYNMRKEGINRFDIDKIEHFLFEESQKPKYTKLFLDVSKDPISKKINLSGTISVLETIGCLKAKVVNGKWIAKVGPIEKSRGLDEHPIMVEIVDDYKKGYIIPSASIKVNPQKQSSESAKEFIKTA